MHQSDMQTNNYSESKSGFRYLKQLINWIGHTHSEVRKAINSDFVENKWYAGSEFLFLFLKNNPSLFSTRKWSWHQYSLLATTLQLMEKIWVANPSLGHISALLNTNGIPLQWRFNTTSRVMSKATINRSLPPKKNTKKILSDQNPIKK